MTFTSLSLLATVVMMFARPAFAEGAAMPSCTRMSGLEKAACLVEQRKAVLKALGRLPAAVTTSSAAAALQPPAPSVVTAAVSSPTPSCSRLPGAKRAQCLEQQRKELLKRLAGVTLTKNVQAQVIPVIAKPKSCSRITDGAERIKCLSSQKR